MASLTRADILSSHPQCADMTSATLDTILAESLRAILDRTHRVEDVGSRWDGIVVDLALVRINQMGAEGSTSVSEGGISRTWDAIPAELRARIDAWRLPIGVAHTQGE